MAVRVRSQSHEADIHDACTLQIAHGIAECGAHAFHLMVLAFGEYDAKCVRIQSFHGTRFGRVVTDIDSVRHAFADIGTQALVHPYAVFFFVVSIGGEERFDDPSVVRKENESVAVFVEPSNRKHVYVRVSLLQVVQYLLFTLLRTMRHRTARFVVSEVDKSLARRMKEYAHVVAFGHLVSKYRGYTIEKHLAGFDELIRFFSSGVPLLREVAVDANRGGVSCRAVLYARSFGARRKSLPKLHIGLHPASGFIRRRFVH